MLDEFTKQTQKATNKIDDQTASYRKFIEWITELEEDWNNFTVQEQEAFRDAFTPFSKYTREPVPPEEVDEVHSRLKKAFRQPIHEAIYRNVEEFTDAIGSEVSREETEIILSKIESWEKEELVKTRDQYRNLIRTIQGQQEVLIAWFSTYIEDNKQVLLEPSTLENRCETYQARHEKLKQINAIFQQTEWPLQDSEGGIGVFSTSALDYGIPDPGSIEDLIEAITEIESRLEEIGIDSSEAVAAQVEEIIADPQNLEEQIESVATRLENLKPRIERVQQAEEITRARIEGEFSPVDTGQLNDTLRRIDQENYADIRGIEGTLESLDSDFDAWKMEALEEWESTVQIINVLEDRFDVPSPAAVEAVDDFERELENNPVEAVNRFGDLQTHIGDLGTELSERIGEPAFNLLKKLITEGDVSVSETELEAIGNLADELPLTVSINDSC